MACWHSLGLYVKCAHSEMRSKEIANQIKLIDIHRRYGSCFSHVFTCIFEAARAGGAGGLGAFVPAVVVLALAIAAYFFLNKA